MSVKLPDLTRQTFGHWLVLAPAENDSHGRTRYLCRCSCGKERLVNAHNLRSGKSTSCGHPGRDKRREDLTGQTFHRLTALRHVGRRGGNPIWLCRCECGRECEVSASNLKDGHTVSCGCRLAEILSSSDLSRAAQAASPLCGKFETNVHARCFCLSRLGRTWHIRNLSHFVRENAELFGFPAGAEQDAARVAKHLYGIADTGRSYLGWRVSHDSSPIPAQHPPAARPVPARPTGYQQAILHLLGTYADGRFLVRCADRWYADAIADLFPTSPYLQSRSEDGKKDLWTLKSARVDLRQDPSDITDWRGFCRGVIELQSSVDLWRHLNGSRHERFTPRLRIYGSAELLSAIMPHLPAAPKKLQRITTQTGSTSALYYQSGAEVVAILSYICGTPANRPLWDRWASIVPQIPRP